jgi:hypothetical protein
MFLMAAAIAYRYSHLSKGNDAQHWMKACLKWVIGTVHIRYICLSPLVILEVEDITRKCTFGHIPKKRVCDLPIFHIVHILSLLNLHFFHIFHIISLFNLLSFHIFHIFTIFFCIFQIFSLFDLFFLNVSWIVKRYGKYGRRISWIVKRYGKYRRKASWIVIHKQVCPLLQC